MKKSKKIIAILLVMATMVFCLAGCGAMNATAVVTFNDFKYGTLLTYIPNTSASLDMNVMTVKVPIEGKYPFIISANDTEYTFTLTYANGQFSGEADNGLTFSIK